MAEMSSALEAAFNEQIVVELSAFYKYLQMAAWFDHASLPGFSAWMRLQAEEEKAHAMRFYDYVLARGNHVKLGDIPSPRQEYSSVLEVMQQALENERKVSAVINKLYAKATEENDYASFPLLQWFVSEQVEEEATVNEILDHIRMIGNDGPSLLLIDREMGARKPEADANA